MRTAETSRGTKAAAAALCMSLGLLAACGNTQTAEPKRQPTPLKELIKPSLTKIGASAIALSSRYPKSCLDITSGKIVQISCLRKTGKNFESIVAITDRNDAQPQASKTIYANITYNYTGKGFDYYDDITLRTPRLGSQINGPYASVIREGVTNPNLKTWEADEIGSQHDGSINVSLQLDTTSAYTWIAAHEGNPTSASATAAVIVSQVKPTLKFVDSGINSPSTAKPIQPKALV